MSTVSGDDRLEQGVSSEAAKPAKSAPKKPTTKQAGATRSRRTSTRASAKASEDAQTAVATLEAPEAPPDAKPRLLELYRSEIVPTMMREFEYRSVMQVPRLWKVVLNVGLGEALTNPKAIESATLDLTTISGQKPVVTRAKNSIAGFKLREGSPIGVMVTLRGVMMYHFVDRLLNAALPRIRDFRGVSTGSFDGRGNYSLGIREQIIFAELEYGQIERIRGFQVSIITTAKADVEAARLLALLGMPFAREN